MNRPLFLIAAVLAFTSPALADSPDFGKLPDGSADGGCSPDDLGCPQTMDLASPAQDLSGQAPADLGAQARDSGIPMPDDGVVAPDLARAPDLATNAPATGGGCSVVGHTGGAGSFVLGALFLLGLALRRRD